METITIKPHHLLDIYKLHGAGLDSFVPNEKYRHDFYRIGNLILNHQVKSIKFTADADVICIPCVFCIDDTCNDTFSHYGTETIKDGYNRELDQRIMTLLEVRVGVEYDYCDILKLLAVKVTESFIEQVWSSSTTMDNHTRWLKTSEGIHRLQNKVNA